MNPFNTGAGGNSADFLWLLLVSMSALLLVGYSFEMLVLSESILYVVMYMWSRREPDAQLNIFGFKFKALYLPWVYIAIRLVMGGSVTEPLLGIGVGHGFYFLSEVLPHTEGYHLGPLLRTPGFCVDLMTYCSGGYRPVNTSFTPREQERPVPQQGQRYQWGRGRTLGAS